MRPNRSKNSRGSPSRSMSQVVGSVTQKLAHPHPGTYVGKGKLEEIKDLRDELGYDIVMIDGDLSPGQQRNLENATST